jgi:hypothetical protein
VLSPTNTAGYFHGASKKSSKIFSRKQTTKTPTKNPSRSFNLTHQTTITGSKTFTLKSRPTPNLEILPEEIHQAKALAAQYPNPSNITAIPEPQSATLINLIIAKNQKSRPPNLTPLLKKNLTLKDGSEIKPLGLFAALLPTYQKGKTLEPESSESEEDPYNPTTIDPDNPDEIARWIKKIPLMKDKIKFFDRILDLKELSKQDKFLDQ